MNTKLHLTLASVLTLALVCSAGIAADEPTFIQQMNAHWQAKEYPQILQKATQAAAQQPPNPEAFAVLFGYYTFIESNHASAVQALDDLLVLIENSNPLGFQARTEFKAEFLQFPAGEIQPLTPEQLQQTHTLFPNVFPAHSLLFVLKKPD